MYTAKEMTLVWDKNIPMDFTTKNKKVVTPQFRSVHNKTEACTVPYLTGTYPIYLSMHTYKLFYEFYKFIRLFLFTQFIQTYRVSRECFHTKKPVK